MARVIQCDRCEIIHDYFESNALNIDGVQYVDMSECPVKDPSEKYWRKPLLIDLCPECGRMFREVFMKNEPYTDDKE